MAENKLTINQLVKQASNNVGSATENDVVVKTAHEQGIEDANRVVKVANYTGDIMGSAAFEIFHNHVASSLGFDPEGIAKTASIADMIDAAVVSSFEKIAEAYSSQTGGENLVTTQMAAQDQIVEQGKANAVLAAQSANDAIASVDMGDANTAAQSMVTAGQNIALAQEAASMVQDPELQAQVQQAAMLVAQAAQALQGQPSIPANTDDPSMVPDVNAQMAAAESAVAQ